MSAMVLQYPSLFSSRWFYKYMQRLVYGEPAEIWITRRNFKLGTGELKDLKLETLRYRRARGDMIEAFKILSGKNDTF